MKHDGCVEYPRARDSKGYGNVRFNGRKWGAHRLAYFWSTGIHPGKSLVCHRCDNPPCVNPEHLFLGTAAENSRDMVAKGRGVAPKGERNGSARLSGEEVRQIRCLLALGMTHRAIAKLFGVNRATVSYIASGKTWAEQ